jgi:plasmid stabilization system protein ParE
LIGFHMKIVYEELFGTQLRSILRFIARDNVSAAKAFRDGLKARIERVPQYPESCRRSLYFEDDTIRDMVFMGYTVIYRITPKEIRVLDIFKWQER